ncbi:hypothetical protein OIV83_001033 [Microbotryomycetes sp. JL201]|nr:hypothetical protein OIV83_001033 [Microbotryomycetes sp. JL201]
MSSPALAAYLDDMDDLDAILDRMDAASLGSAISGQRTTAAAAPRPRSSAFPTRSSSRNSSTSRLSAKPSVRSFNSLSSNTSTNTNLAGPKSDDDVTPSLNQGEWAQRQRGIRATASALTGRKPRPPPLRDDAGNSRHFGQDGSPGSSVKSVPSTPRSATRSPTSLHPPSTASPSRLMPRSPLSDRTPLDDLAFLKDLNDWAENDHDSIRSGTSSNKATNSRSQRLREDIEKAARRLRQTTTAGESAGSTPPPVSSLPPSPLPPSPLPPSSSTLASPAPSDLDVFRPQLDTRSSSTSSGVPTSSLVHSGLPLFPGASVSYTSLKSSLDDSTLSHLKDEDTKSLASFQSAESIKPLASGLWHSSLGSPLDRRESRLRTDAAREMREWSQGLLVWQKDQVGSSSASTSKHPFMREVPSVVKRKIGSSKRESTQLFSATEALMFGLDEGQKAKEPKQKEKEKDKSDKMKGADPGRDGSWHKAIGVLRDDGYFRVYAEDKSALHSVHLPSLNRHDIRPLDRSVFDKPNCVVIYRKKGSHITPFNSTFHPSATDSAIRNAAEEPVFVRMPSIVAMQTWLVMAHCFAKPEFYLSTGATTPRPMRTPKVASFNEALAADLTPYEDDTSASQGGADDTRCRVFRSLYVSINEGKNIGRAAVEVVRHGPKPSLEVVHRPASFDNDTSTLDVSPTKTTGGGFSRLANIAFGSEKDSAEIDSFCEVLLDGDVVARTSVRPKTNCPFWNEGFTFGDLPQFTEPLVLRLFQIHKQIRPVLLGTCTVRLADLPRAELIDSWCSIRSPSWQGGSTATVGELNLSVRVNEEVVLPSQEYAPLLQLLRDDCDAQLPQDIAHEFPSSLEELSRLLLRIYQADNLVLPRICKLVEIEVGSNTKSAAILFRGNTVLTKMVELFMRLIGTEFLEAAIGEPVRRICKEQVAVEIDPAKMKAGTKDKEITHNLHELHEWCLVVWNAIYDARRQCPDDLRRIFKHVQQVAEAKYGDEQKNIKWTSVGAFVFLRFFVPAILNPKLFGIVKSPPDIKSQRTLTLIAKTLQGLANFSSFGQKEPWMVGLNLFLQDHTPGYIDFIDHISTQETSTSAMLDWTSPDSPAYLAPARLRSTLPPLIREGVPVLPHLIDLPKELGLLAAFISRGIVDKGPPPAAVDTALSGARARSARFTELAEVCVDIQEEARRRGRPLYAPQNSSLLDSRARARADTNESRHERNHSPSRPSFSINAFPTTPPRARDAKEEPASTSTDEILHIRPRPVTPPEPVSTDVSSPLSDKSSAASRKSHRNVVINGVSPRRESLPGGRPLSPEHVYSSRTLPPAAIPAPDFSFSHFSSVPLSAASSPPMGEASPRMSYQTTKPLTSQDLEDSSAFMLSSASSRRNTKTSVPPSGPSATGFVNNVADSDSTSSWTLLPDEAEALAARPPVDPSHLHASGLMPTSQAMQQTRSTSSWASSSHLSDAVSTKSSNGGGGGGGGGGERRFLKSLFGSNNSNAGPAKDSNDLFSDSCSVKSGGAGGFRRWK